MEYPLSFLQDGVHSNEQTNWLFVFYHIICFLGIPRDYDFSVVQDTFLAVEGIQSVHNLRIWGLTTDKVALSAHLAIGKKIILWKFKYIV